MNPHLASALAHSSSAASTSIFSSPSAEALGMAQPAPARPRVYHCNFCDKKFTSCHGLSGHYNVHKNLPQEMWVRFGPLTSKVRKGILQAAQEGRTYEFKRKTWTRRSPRARKTRVQTQVQARDRYQARIQARAQARDRYQARAEASDRVQAQILCPQPIRAVFPDQSPQLPWCALGVVGSNRDGASVAVAAPGPQIRDVGQAGTDGPDGPLVLGTDFGPPPYRALRPNFRETGPVIRIQGPNGLLIRRAYGAEVSNLASGSRTDPMVEYDGPPGFPPRPLHAGKPSSSSTTAPTAGPAPPNIEVKKEIHTSSDDDLNRHVECQKNKNKIVIKEEY